jgi:hypothetical protein
MTSGMTGALYRLPALVPPAAALSAPDGLDADEPAVVEAEACAVTVAERRTTRLVVGAGEQGQARWLDFAVMADHPPAA